MKLNSTKTGATFVQEVRVDCRVVATILRYLRQNGIEPQTYSGLLRLSLTLFADMLTQQGLSAVTKVQTVAEALQEFEAAQLSLPVKQGRNLQSLAHALAEELTEAEVSVEDTALDLAARGERTALGIKVVPKEEPPSEEPPPPEEAPSVLPLPPALLEEDPILPNRKRKHVNEERKLPT